MNYTTNYNLNKPEGTDLYNHLTVDNPNMDSIDAAMYANKLQCIGNATELVSGTVHALTRADSDQNIFKFKATGNFVAGDSITVDGVSVNAYTTAGQQLPDNAYVLSAEVVCILDGTSLWIISNKTPEASDVKYDASNTVEQMITAQGNILALNEGAPDPYFTTYPNGKDAYTSEVRITVPIFKTSGTTTLTGAYVYDSNGSITNITNDLHVSTATNNIGVTIAGAFNSTYAGKLLRIDLSN